MAVKIKLQRLGKIRNPQYRVVIADARTRRDGKVIENIGIYQPKENPSLIRINSERAQYWLGVGAQPTDPVLALLKITGDWQKFKGLPGAEGKLRVAPEKPKKHPNNLIDTLQLERTSPRPLSGGGFSTPVPTGVAQLCRFSWAHRSENMLENLSSISKDIVNALL